MIDSNPKLNSQVISVGWHKNSRLMVAITLNLLWILFPVGTLGRMVLPESSFGMVQNSIDRNFYSSQVNHEPVKDFFSELSQIWKPGFKKQNCYAKIQDLAPAERFEIPGGLDSNSPYFWTQKNGQWQLRLFSSAWDTQAAHTRNSVLVGTDIRNLVVESIDVGMGSRKSLHWIEGIFPKSNGELLGWYHSEYEQQCGSGTPNPDGYAPQGKRVPKVGHMISRDDGKTWVDQGIVVRAARDTHDCTKTKSVFFAGGLGDPWVVPDQDGKYFYMFYGHYVSKPSDRQGISVARIARADLENQKDKWFKFRKENGWSNKGRGGDSAPIFSLEDPINHGFLDEKPNGFWGPAVYFDRKAKTYFMLMSLTKDRESWGSEGYYISFNKDLSKPNDWTQPERLSVPGERGWYPQLVSETPGLPYTETNGPALLLVHGHVHHTLEVGCD